MKAMLLWGGVGIVLLCVSLFVNVNSDSIVAWVGKSAGLWFVLLLIVSLLSTVRKKFRQKSYAGVVLLMFFATLIFPVFYLFSSVLSIQGCTLQYVPYHFRTNTITGHCEVGRGGGGVCPYQEPWYYKDGCSVRAEEELNINGGVPVPL